MPDLAQLQRIERVGLIERARHAVARFVRIEDRFEIGIE